MKLSDIFNKWVASQPVELHKDIWCCVEEKTPQLIALFNVEFEDNMPDKKEFYLRSSELDGMSVGWFPRKFVVGFCFYSVGHEIVTIDTYHPEEVTSIQRTLQCIPGEYKELFKYLPLTHDDRISYFNIKLYHLCRVCGKYVSNYSEDCPSITE